MSRATALKKQLKDAVTKDFKTRLLSATQKEKEISSPG
jgi:hypothetical protein